MEFPWRRPSKSPGWYSPHFEVKNGVIHVPTGAGLGVDFDPDFLKKAVLVELS